MASPISNIKKSLILTCCIFIICAAAAGFGKNIDWSWAKVCIAWAWSAMAFPNRPANPVGAMETGGGGGDWWALGLLPPAPPAPPPPAMAAMAVAKAASSWGCWRPNIWPIPEPDVARPANKFCRAAAEVGAFWPPALTSGVELPKNKQTKTLRVSGGSFQETVSIFDE